MVLGQADGFVGAPETFTPAVSGSDKDFMSTQIVGDLFGYLFD